MLNGTLGRPDLVLVRAGEALVVDVTVRFEYAPDTLKSAAAEKSKKYGCIRNEVAGCFDVRSVRVFGFPMGAQLFCILMKNIMSSAHNKLKLSLLTSLQSKVLT